MAKLLDVFGVMDSFYTDKLVAETNPYPPSICTLQRCEVLPYLALGWLKRSVKLPSMYVCSRSRDDET